MRDVEWIEKYTFEYPNRIKLPKPIVGFPNTLRRLTNKSKLWSQVVNTEI